jgi:co-chaperonin GroES (HSP10)
VAKPSIESAFIQKEDLVLDPSLLNKTVLERMPITSKGGIHLTKETVDRESLATVVAYVVKKGLLCYSDKEKYGETPWCEEGDWVLIGRYAGARFKLDDGDEVRIINDDEVIGTILNPDDIVSSWR